MKKISLGFIAFGLFTFFSCRTTITDFSGNTYKTVKIGKQKWMGENLRTATYSDGTPIMNITKDEEWESLTKGAWSYYKNDNQNDSSYGRLYNWYAVTTEKLCPIGWHVPSDTEWDVLINYLGSHGHSGKEGTPLKSISGWIDYEDLNGNGKDDYGWLGLPSGGRSFNGDFYGIVSGGLWWSSSDGDTDIAWNRSLFSFDSLVSRYSLDKNNGFSVRCLKN